MPVAGEIFDPTQDLVNRFRRFIFRIGAPILGVILVVIVVVGYTYRSYHATKAGALKLTHVILESEQSRISQEVGSYLRPATKGSVLLADMLEHISSEYKQDLFYTYASSSLNHVKQISSFYLADNQGQFTSIERHQANQQGQFDIITLEPNAKGGQFLKTYKTVQGNNLESNSYPANAYDPRKREWYRNATSTDRVVWSKPYVLPSLKQLVVTASKSFIDRNGRQNVFAVNISLNQLISFLSSLHISDNARTIIIDRDGNIIASREMLLKVGQEGWDPENNKIDPKQEPLLAKAYDKFLTQGYGVHNVQFKEKNYISITAKLPSSVQHWAVMIVMPESDFANFAAADGKQNFLFSLLIIALAAMMAGLLIWQGHKTERLGQNLRYVKRVAENETQTLEEIANKPEIFDLTDEALIFTEKLSQLTMAKRVSIWRLIHKGETLICDDVFDRLEGTHNGGLEYSNTEIPDFFALLKKGEYAEIDHVDHYSGTQQFYRVFMQTVKTYQMVLAPIIGKDGILGIIVLEDIPNVQQVRHIVKIFARLLSIRFEVGNLSASSEIHNAKQQNESKPNLPHPLTSNLRDDLANDEDITKQNHLIPPDFSFIQAQSEENNKLRQHNIYPLVPVMNIAFTGTLSPDIDQSASLIKPIEELILSLQQISRQYNLSYVKIMGGNIIAATGCKKKPEAIFPIQLASAALDMRAACIEMMSNANIDSTFGIGIDVGPVIGSWLGKEPSTFNLWGPAIRMSAIMANMAGDGGAIQVTQSAYEYLGEDFLFRPRGTFFVPKVGVGRTFILAGRK